MNLSSAPGVKLTKEELAFIWNHVATSRNRSGLASVGTAIGWIESGEGYTNIYRPATENPLGGQDTGLMQINSEAWGHIDPVALFDPIFNINSCISIFIAQEAAGKDGWWPWNYGPDAYGPKIQPPGTPRPARTDTSINLAAAVVAMGNMVNPYWKMFDAKMDVHDLPVPLKGTYVSALPPAPLKSGDSGGITPELKPYIRQLQIALYEMGRFTGTMDYYYGTRVKTGVQSVQSDLVKCNLWPADKIDGTYSVELRNVWDGALQFGYIVKGR